MESDRNGGEWFVSEHDLCSAVFMCYEVVQAQPLGIVDIEIGAGDLGFGLGLAIPNTVAYGSPLL